MDSSSMPEPENTANNVWVLRSAFLVLTMQAGFGMLEAGVVNQGNTVNIMMKNVGDVCVGGLAWVIFGFGLAFGNDGENSFLGEGNFFFMADVDDKVLPFFIFQFAFAATAATIVSGAVAERMKFGAYLLTSVFMTGFIYPVTVHWVWDADGWLVKEGFFDFAGCGPVHMVGGVAGLVAAKMLGNRVKPPRQPSAPVSMLLGLFILWWGWYGFNAGSTMEVTGNKDVLAARVAYTTTMAACSAGAMSVVISLWRLGYYDVSIVVNGVLAGLVSITAGCAVVTGWEAVLIGLIGCALQYAAEHLIAKAKIDDPISAFTVHGVCGMWGLVSVGLFANNANIAGLTGIADVGIFHGGSFRFLGYQIAGMIAIAAWSATLMFLWLTVLDKLVGIRVSNMTEILGLDLCDHGITTGVDMSDMLHLIEAHQNGQDLFKTLDQRFHEDYNLEQNIMEQIRSFLPSAKHGASYSTLTNKVTPEPTKEDPEVWNVSDVEQQFDGSPRRARSGSVITPDELRRESMQRLTRKGSRGNSVTQLGFSVG